MIRDISSVNIAQDLDDIPSKLSSSVSLVQINYRFHLMVKL